LHDLALVLYLNPETGEPRHNSDHICETCGESGGAHYCEPRWVAHTSLERQLRKYLRVHATSASDLPSVETIKERDFALLHASHGRLRSVLEDIAQHDGADWDVEGVCGQAVDALAYIPDPPPFDEVVPDRRATLDRGPTLTHKQRLVYTRTRSLGKTHEQAVKQAMLSSRPAAA
jgi:hypothetical protein